MNEAVKLTVSRRLRDKAVCLGGPFMTSALDTTRCATLSTICTIAVVFASEKTCSRV
jgi:hypothetical protein